MLKRLLDMQGGKAVVIDLPLLAIIGAEKATALDLTTDGQRLILSVAKETETLAIPGAPSRSTEFHADDPKETLRLIDELQRLYGLTQEHFRRLHHFGPKSSLEQHIRYCEGTIRFSSQTNAIVARRLALCLKLRSEGQPWETAIAQASSQFRFPPRRGV